MLHLQWQCEPPWSQKKINHFNEVENFLKWNIFWFFFPINLGTGRPVWNQELESMIFLGPFQLKIFYSSMTYML